jgi:hypothetical protein
VECFQSEGTEYSIFSGSLIIPWAKFVLLQNQIDRLIVDITWKVTSQYMTAGRNGL